MQSIKIEPLTKRGRVSRLLGLTAPSVYLEHPLGSTATTDTSGLFQIVNIEDDGNRYLSYLLVFEWLGALYSVAISKTNATSICKALNEFEFEQIVEIQEINDTPTYRILYPSEIYKRATLQKHKDILETVWGQLKNLEPKEAHIIINRIRKRIQTPKRTPK